MEEVQARNELFSAMSGGKPFKTYKKAILGKVFVHIWDSFTEAAVGVILKGDPRRDDPNCFIDVWDQKEDTFFTKRNFRHLQSSTVIPVTRKDEEVPQVVREITDNDLREVANSKFLALQSYLNKTESVGTLFRLLSMAKDLDKSDKILSAIEARISEIQSRDLKITPEDAGE